MGPKVIFEVALSILKFHEKKLLTIYDVTESAMYLNQQVSKIFNVKPLFEVINKRKIFIYKNK